jgi:hypothetical protein
MSEMPEREFMGGRKSKLWTYLILMMLLVVGAIVFNLVFNNPAMAKEGVKSFFGLPGWALAAITFVVGALIYWLGLKIETDWPEAIGAFLIAASVLAFEVIIGWNRFDVGGLFVLPYLLPIAVFVILLMIGMKKSV